MPRSDPAHHPALDDVVSLLRDVTQASTSADSITTFMQRYRRVRPVDVFLGVRSASNDPAGGYRIIYEHVDGDDSVDRPASCEDAAKLPVHHGGLIARLIADPTPKLVADFSLGSDPALAHLPRDLATVMALPIFAGVDVEEWAITFSRQPASAFSADDLARALMTGNLLAMANRHLDSFATISRLHTRLRDQFDQVARVQQQLLPSRTPDVPGLEIATSYIPSELAGGDYYDFFRLPGETWGVLIADVSGHGAAAATIMAMLHAILHAYAPISEGSGPPNPADVLEFANARLVHANLEGAFVTAIFAVFDPVAGVLTFANAGHPPPRLKSGLDGSIHPLDSDAAVPLGILTPLGASSRSITLRPNDSIVLYTDGITESFDLTGDMFGTTRLDQALHDCTGAPDCIVESVHKALFEHRGGPTRDDDQTLVALRFHGLCVL